MNLVKELQYTQPSKYSLRAVSTYFDDGDLYVNGFSSEDQDHPWELLLEKSVTSLEFGSDKYVN